MISVTTNNVPRDVLNAWDLTPAERAEFDYIDWQAVDEGVDQAEFFRYRGQLYDLHDGFLVNIPEGTPGRWDGFQSDSFFSGIVIRYCDDYERVVVGTLVA